MVATGTPTKPPKRRRGRAEVGRRRAVEQPMAEASPPHDGLPQYRRSGAPACRSPPPASLALQGFAGGCLRGWRGERGEVGEAVAGGLGFAPPAQRRRRDGNPFLFSPHPMLIERAFKTLLCIPQDLLVIIS
jgi:hypothetical protein